MLYAGEKARSDDTGRRVPGFILATENLDCYRPWLKRIREWARKQGGRIMEAHLIGDEVPAAELTDEAIGCATRHGGKTDHGVCMDQDREHAGRYRHKVCIARSV